MKFMVLDFAVYPLMAGIEPPRMTAHGDQACFPLPTHNLFRVSKPVSEGNLHLDMLAGFKALDRLLCMHLGWRA